MDFYVFIKLAALQINQAHLDTVRRRYTSFEESGDLNGYHNLLQTEELNLQV